MAKRKSSKNLSLDDAFKVVSENQARRGAQDAEHAAATEAAALESAPQRHKRRLKRTQITLYLKRDHLAEIRSAVLDLAERFEEPSSISAFVEQALAREIVRMRRERNGGKPWPLREEPMPTGRRERP